MEIWTIFIVFAIAIFLNIPIGYSLTAAALTTIVITEIVPYKFLVSSFFSSGDSFPLLAIPFFILAGDIMMHGGISKRLVGFATTLMAGKIGSMGMITVVTCLIFAAISGSGPATVAAIGGIMIPAMKKENYDPAYAGALTAAAGSLGPVIPPSISLVLYGVLAGVSITDLFIAGIVPGILMAIAMMIFVYVTARKYKFGIVREKATTKEKWKSFSEAKWALVFPVIILGGIYGGIFTPTEAAIVACDYGLIVGLFIYKDLKFKDLYRIFVSSALTTGTVMVLAGSAGVFARLISIQQIPAMISNGILELTSSKIVVLILVNVVLFVAGMLIDTITAILILAPLLLSVVTPFGVDPLHFGLICIVNLVIGMCTPPVGINTFVAAGIAEIPFESMFKWLVPLIISLIGVLLLITYIPALSTFLPTLLK